jgi:hypothetical protein
MDAERFFIQFLLGTTSDQQLALLSTVTDSQVKALTEIAYNLPKLIDLGPQQNFVTYLGNQKHTLRYKKSLIKNHAARLIKVLSTVKESLLELAQ